MTSTRNEQIEKLLAAARALPADHRESFLRRESGEDTALCEEVLRRLRQIPTGSSPAALLNEFLAANDRRRADANLLFGILAVQMDFVGRDRLIEAMNAWVLEKSKNIGQILLDQGALARDTHQLLEALVAKHLQLHEQDVEKSLAAVSSVESIRDDLKRLGDAEVEASLAHVSAARRNDQNQFDTTITVGTSTAPGQRFRVLRPHAKGGLGEVFVAEDLELHREVALKEIQARYPGLFMGGFLVAACGPCRGGSQKFLRG